MHIFYILWGRNSKFGAWMYLGMAECHMQFLGHCDLDLVFRIVLSVAYLILFELGIPNLLC